MVGEAAEEVALPREDEENLEGEGEGRDEGSRYSTVREWLTKKR